MKEKEKPKQLTADGLPKDAKDWTFADWLTLHEMVEKAKRTIAARHQPTSEDADPCSRIRPRP